MCRIITLFVVIIGAYGCQRSAETLTEAESASAFKSAENQDFGFRAARLETYAGVRIDVAPHHFTNVAVQVGIDFSYDNGASSRQLMVESLGGGVAWLDFDCDGWPDLFFPQGGKPDAAIPATRASDQLYRNRGGDGFQRVLIDDIRGEDYSNGVAIGDFDSDGFDDIYVTNVGPNKLYRNLGDGTFEEVAKETGVDGGLWSSSAAWADLNADGLLDLYVCNYLRYDPYHPKECKREGVPAICHPRELPPAADYYYLNCGDGKFLNTAREIGLHGEGNRALGVVAADFNNDSRVDVYVCNDTDPNFLFLQRPDQSFSESALLLGAALSSMGSPQASMGVAVGDFDNNHALDLCVTHFSKESNAVYQNMASVGTFRDVSGLTAMQKVSFPKLGFGIVMRDFNGDGAMDLFVANGHIDPMNADGDGYEQQAQLISFDGAKWNDVSHRAGNYFGEKRVGRGAAVADYDRDGDLDIAVVSQNSSVALLRNETESNLFTSLQFRGVNSSRKGVNTRIWVDLGGKVRMYELTSGGSYCSTHFTELVVPNFGHREGTITIQWASGKRFEYSNLALSAPIVFTENGSSYKIR